MVMGTGMPGSAGIELFSACPQSKDSDGARYRQRVAVQPLYMHPYTAAKMVAPLGHLHGRRIYLNMLAGGFKNDLVALNDTTPHDQRCERTVEYTLLIKRLLSGPGPISFERRYYQVRNLRIAPPLPTGLFPGILISGSSPAGLAAAKAIGATAVKYPAPADQLGEEPPDAVHGRPSRSPVPLETTAWGEHAHRSHWLRVLGIEASPRAAARA
jgi:alkanesulfonate monooxygenase SsuD/methylene tetrahydromethanopterin reductase-like flavin-dependent oxidoreductase (luciferase family)